MQDSRAGYVKCVVCNTHGATPRNSAASAAAALASWSGNESGSKDWCRTQILGCTYIYIYLSLSPSVSLSLSLAVSLSLYIPLLLLICVYIYISLSVSFSLSLSLSVSLSLSLYLSIYISICIYIYIPLSLSPSLSHTLHTRRVRSARTPSQPDLKNEKLARENSFQKPESKTTHISRTFPGHCGPNDRKQPGNVPERFPRNPKPTSQKRCLFFQSYPLLYIVHP